MGLIGALTGAIFIVVFRQLRQIMQPLNQHLIVRGLIGRMGLGFIVTTMKAPIFSALFVMVLMQAEISPAIAIAVIVGMLATVRISMTATKA